LTSVRGTTDDKRLARAHRLALQLVALGASDELMAECLGIEPEAVAPLVEVATAKAADVGVIVDVSDVAVSGVIEHGNP
jgi:hypothetical protein